eukprot:scaffold13621_cov135-Isochrysis_galbana.AAC.2
MHAPCPALCNVSFGSAPFGVCMHSFGKERSSSVVRRYLCICVRVVPLWCRRVLSWLVPAAVFGALSRSLALAPGPWRLLGSRCACSHF